jgi:hypothetical protein
LLAAKPFNNDDIQRTNQMIAKHLQAQSSIVVPGQIAQIMASANLPPIAGKIGIDDLDRKLKAAGTSIHHRTTLKAWLHSAGLLVSGGKL